MKITRQKFREKSKDGTLKLAFIGMSNVGKTKISKQLEVAGFNRIEVDKGIWTHLNLPSITAVAEWLGFPNTQTFTEREQMYLDAENVETIKAMDTLVHPSVLDTTGSAIYLPERTLQRLRDEWLVVYIATSEKDIHELFATFMKEPKPVLWQGQFTQEVGESVEKSLARCYPLLLKDRMQRYRRLAHVSVNRFAFYKAKNVDDILRIIEDAL